MFKCLTKKIKNYLLTYRKDFLNKPQKRNNIKVVKGENMFTERLPTLRLADTKIIKMSDWQDESKTGQRRDYGKN